MTRSGRLPDPAKHPIVASVPEVTIPTALIPTPPRTVLKRKPAEALPVSFLAKAAGLPGGRTLAVALALCIEAASARCRTITFGSWLRTRYAISDDAALDALNRLRPPA